MQQTRDQPRNTSGALVEQEAHQLGHRDAAQEAGAPAESKNCRQCFEQIALEARKCKHCGSHLDHRRFINFSSTILSLVLAIIAVSTVMLQVYSQQDFGGLFLQRAKYVAYFSGSVKGLQVGAPVDFRGVTIGRVVDIKVQAREMNAWTLVVVGLDPGQIEVIKVIGSEATDSPDGPIQAGLRAQLQSQSLLTGELFVNLDFYPASPVRLVGGDQPYPEIPTIPSEIEQLQQSAGDVAARLPALLDVLNGLFIDLNQSLDQTGGNFNSIVSDVAVIAREIRESTPEVVARTVEATEEIRRVAATLEDLLRTNRDAMGAIIHEGTIAEADSRRRAADGGDRPRAHDQPGAADPR